MNDQDLKITELNQIRAIEHFKSVISMAELSLKTSILINGGAAVSILTFLGNTKVNFKLLVTVSLIVFALGVFFGGVGTLLAYMAQNDYMQRINNKEERSSFNIYKSAGIISWFRENLKAPKWLAKSNKPNAKFVAISWFKDSATEYISKMREFVSILEEHGVEVQQLTTERPGYIVYEDERQVSAEPYNDTFV